MINPFDRTFFSFFFGFACILLASFVVLYFVGRYNVSTEAETAAVLKSYYASRTGN